MTIAELEIDWNDGNPGKSATDKEDTSLVDIFHQIRQMSPSPSVSNDYFEGFNAALDAVELLIRRKMDV